MEMGFALGCGLVKGRRQARRPFRSHQPPCTHDDDGKGSPVISLYPVAHQSSFVVSTIARRCSERLVHGNLVVRVESVLLCLRVECQVR